MHSYGDWGYLGLGVDAASQPGLGPSPWRSALGTMVGLAKGVLWAALQVRWDLVTAPPESLSPPVTTLPSLRRWQQSVKSSGLASNLQPSGAKADALREEMEEAANRVEICRVPGRPGGIAPSWGGGTSASQAQQKTCSLSSFPVLHSFLAPLPVINPPPAGPRAQTQPGGSGGCSPAKQDIPGSSVPILRIPPELESIPLPRDLSRQEPASSAPRVPSPGTETRGKRRRVPSPHVPPGHVPPRHPAGHRPTQLATLGGKSIRARGDAGAGAFVVGCGLQQ